MKNCATSLHGEDGKTHSTLPEIQMTLAVQLWLPKIDWGPFLKMLNQTFNHTEEHPTPPLVLPGLWYKMKRPSFSPKTCRSWVSRFMLLYQILAAVKCYGVTNPCPGGQHRNGWLTSQPPGGTYDFASAASWLPACHTQADNNSDSAFLECLPETNVPSFNSWMILRVGELAQGQRLPLPPSQDVNCSLWFMTKLKFLTYEVWQRQKETNIWKPNKG